MFWIKRLKGGDDESSWALPYGDLMSLLLVVFVMIAAMSELQAGTRFDSISLAVQDAFGFSSRSPADAITAESPVPTLLDRLAEAGIRRESAIRLTGPDDRLLAVGELVVDRDLVTLRLPSAAMFDRFSAKLDVSNEEAIGRLGEFLLDGGALIEVRGHCNDGPIPADVPFRDGFDLAYARARAVADVLTGAGVARDRMQVTARASGVLRVGLAEQADRWIEIIVHAVPAVSRASVFAEKE